ncbi:CotO family spore coat protein [Mesobacillus maritimus]|uniref:CotO family spore coat protein n=1 Tax=Mesobacillus maritimus TaxID=1643336 RepID=UPI00384B53F8
MSTRKIKHKPVLYISQPITQFPDIMMQERYSTRDELYRKQVKSSNEIADAKKVVNEHQIKTEYRDREIVNKTDEVIPVADEVESTSNPFDTKRKRHYSLKRVKHFREMAVSEKLIYLENFPEQLGPIFCLYFTETTTYTGILLNNFEEKIEIQLPNNSQATIMIEELQDIRMLGFH